MAKLSTLQRKRITRLFNLTPDDWKEIKKYNFNWDSKDLKPIIDRIRNHYLNEQSGLCSFCKLPFRDDVQVEHFIPKSGAKGMPGYTFNAKNLSVACKHCNSKKSTNNDMMPWNREPYPSSSIYFKIVHPHFDDYFRNIEIVDKSRYVSKSVKGFKTIERCKLYHPTILGVLTKTMRYEDDGLIQGVLRLREIQGDFRATIDRFVNRIFQ